MRMLCFVYMPAFSVKTVHVIKMKALLPHRVLHESICFGNMEYI